MTVIVFGSEGMLGSDVVSEYESASYQVVFFSKQELDITNHFAVSEAISTIEPELIINCAAYTDVDKAEEKTKKADSVNGFGPSSISSEAAKVGCPVVYVSTDYVFDGLKGRPYLESDITSPISAYGMSKLKGEEATRAFNNKHFIVRTAGLYGLNGDNFVKAILRASKEKKELEVVNVFEKQE